jgi:protein-S-isoprenylcysteine O-methyltransferase Ste14
MYLGPLLVLTGTAWLLGSAAAWLPVPVFASIIRSGYIEGEERFLDQPFGEETGRTRLVRRWI